MAKPNAAKKSNPKQALPPIPSLQGMDRLWVLAAFGLFRLFDVLKPWPISWLDAKVHGGVGIMVDDLVAGVMAAAVVCLIAVSGLY